MFLERPSGSHTPSGRVVPTSPGVMAVICTDAAAVVAPRGASAALYEHANCLSSSLAMGDAKQKSRGELALGV